MKPEPIDEVGPWTEIKLEIIKNYLPAYTKILKNQKESFTYYYIDAFAGYGEHISAETGMRLEGSPKIALGTTPSFSRYFFVDLNGEKIKHLREISTGRDNVEVFEEDCNKVLIENIFPICRYDEYKRALCVIDPYNLNPSWDVMLAAGKSKTIEILLNFMTVDVERKITLRNTDKIDPNQAARLSRFWGDDSWREVVYTPKQTLFGPIEEKENIDELVRVYVERLKNIAGFSYAAKPLPFYNTHNRLIYYLVFVSPNKTGADIVQGIFSKFRRR